MRSSFALLMMVVLPCVLLAQAPEKRKLLGTAKSASVSSDVVWNKQRRFDSNAVLARMDLCIAKTALNKQFRFTSASHADIIVKFHEDVVLIGNESISATAYDPEDNAVIFTEERSLIDEENDLNRLVSHLLQAVEEQRALLAGEQHHLLLESTFSLDKVWNEADAAVRQDVTPIKIWVRGTHLYESFEAPSQNMQIFSARCDSVAGSVPDKLPNISVPPLYAGTCAYTIKWISQTGGPVLAKCNLETHEIITVLDPNVPAISGWSQRIDWSPLKATPPACPIPGMDWRNFTYKLAQTYA